MEVERSRKRFSVDHQSRQSKAADVPKKNSHSFVYSPNTRLHHQGSTIPLPLVKNWSFWFTCQIAFQYESSSCVILQRFVIFYCNSLNFISRPRYWLGVSKQSLHIHAENMERVQVLDQTNFIRAIWGNPYWKFEPEERVGGYYRAEHHIRRVLPWQILSLENRASIRQQLLYTPFCSAYALCAMPFSPLTTSIIIFNNVVTAPCVPMAAPAQSNCCDPCLTVLYPRNYRSTQTIYTEVSIANSGRLNRQP